MNALWLDGRFTGGKIMILNGGDVVDGGGDSAVCLLLSAIFPKHPGSKKMKTQT